MNYQPKDHPELHHDGEKALLALMYVIVALAIFGLGGLAWWLTSS